MDDMISCYGGASEAVSARIDSALKKFRELSGMLVWKQGLPLKQQGKNFSVLCYTSFVVLLQNVGNYCYG